MISHFHTYFCLPVPESETQVKSLWTDFKNVEDFFWSYLFKHKMEILQFLNFTVRFFDVTSS